ncbi:MAG: hypothetical protein JST68_25630 [Bacteroidetes bacterium]|nr:hypothetical protein [Bacteroidota bacterium]
MRTLTVLAAVLFFSAAANQLQAQSLKNTAWKFYLEPLHDTLTMHIGSDSSFCTTSTGDVVVRSVCKTENDTIKIMDFDGQYNCQNGEGIYKFAVAGDMLSFTLVNDPCPNRADALVGVKFFKINDKK